MIWRAKVILCVLSVAHAWGLEMSACPEAKKPYLGDCRLFYKCVPLEGSAQAYVWVPTRCGAGLVFQPTLKTCVLPGNIWNCTRNLTNQGNDFSSLLESLDEEAEESSETATRAASANELDVETAFGGDEYESTTFPNTDGDYETIKPVYNSGGTVLNAMDQDWVPLSAVNNTSTDQIGQQMQRLKQLINSLKPSGLSSTPSPEMQNPNYYPYETLEPQPQSGEPFPNEMNAITVQLVPQIPPLTEIDASSDRENISYPSMEYIVSALFKKYLSNENFLHDGEYVKLSERKNYHSKRRPQPPEHKSSIVSPHYYHQECINGVRYPNPDDCTRYFICSKSNMKMQSYACPPNTAFSKVKRVCDVNEYEICAKEAGNLPEEQITATNEVPCDREMCGGLQQFGGANPLECPPTLIYCFHKQKCLPKFLCQ